MGLDLYVGSLTRYFTRDFQTPVQRMFGDKVSTLRVGADGGVRVERGPARDVNPRSVRRVVSVWRAEVAQQLGSALEKRLDWDETNAAPWWCEQPTWAGYGGLALLAAYDERPDLMPTVIDVERWERDPAVSAVRSAADSRFRHFHQAELWAPAAFDRPVMSEGLTPQPIGVGSTSRLLECLLDLNQRTWRADPAALEATGPADSEVSGFEASAWRGFSVFLTLARAAVEHHLPMKMDY